MLIHVPFLKSFQRKCDSAGWSGSATARRCKARSVEFANLILSTINRHHLSVMLQVVVARHFNSTGTTANSSFSPGQTGQSPPGAFAITAFSGAATGPLLSAGSMGTLQQPWLGATMGSTSKSLAATVVRSTGSYPGMGTGGWAGMPSSSAGAVQKSSASVPASMLRRVNWSDEEVAFLPSATAPPPSGRTKR